LTVAFIEDEKRFPDGIRVEGTSNCSVPHKLLAATEKYYAVFSQASNEKSIEFDRDSVAGMVVLEDH
jgi:hypothetical protein